ncbi:metallopeptidase family protein [Glycomyces sp. TRM65418]|uniref:metallopeptidase family protein n=1 Tax=Glycomyces sp. TRM65418 TaxID=2867006 RepID=UPI001CE6288F|nr:metallopeptidase family protein [Glycomyces sp. TRM65418]MCC3762875.1 metallopeptidase family protein [Glycomyces sp. TRM65418]QZD56901.1 metallopeptidase family protein [Glycomyces sp. TRM65418]
MRRDRHGRGMRGPLAPGALPLRRTPVEQFDALVMDSVVAIERRLSESLGSKFTDLRHIEFAVDEVPPETQAYDADIVEERGVPLSKLYPAQPGTVASSPRIVLYRRPIELRAESRAEAEALVRSVLAEQLASLLNLPPEELEF